MSEVRVNKLSPRSGTTVTLGDSGDTISIPSGVTLSNAGTNTFASATITGDLTVDTNTLKVDSTNNKVGILTSSPAKTLQVLKSDDYALRVGASDYYWDLGSISGSSPKLNAVGTSTSAIFEINGSEKMRIDSSGNLLVGKTNNDLSNDGIVIREGGEILATNTSGLTANFNRLSTDGRIVSFYKDGTEVGSIGVDGGDSLIGTGDTGIRFYDAVGQLLPRTTSGGASNNSIDLGSTVSNFRDLYLGGGLYVGGTGSANKLDDYEEGTWTPGLENVTVTYTSRTGQYVKVGKLVYFAGTIVLASNDTGDSSSVRISGLPFAIDSTNNSVLFTMNASLSTLFDSYHNVGGAYVGSILTTAIDIGDNSNGGAIQYEDLQASGTMVFSGQYITT
jgi:hypothetical protein